MGYSFVDQALILFLLRDNFLDKIEIKDVQPYIRQFVSYRTISLQGFVRDHSPGAGYSEDMIKQLQEIAE